MSQDTTEITTQIIDFFFLNIGEEIKETTTEIKAPKGQVVAIANVPQPKLVVHKGQKGHKLQGNKLVQ